MQIAAKYQSKAGENGIQLENFELQCTNYAISVISRGNLHFLKFVCAFFTAMDLCKPILYGCWLGRS